MESCSFLHLQDNKTERHGKEHQHTKTLPRKLECNAS